MSEAKLLTLDELGELNTYFGEHGELPHGVEEALLDMAVNCLEWRATATAEASAQGEAGRWITCEERQPDKAGMYLAHHNEHGFDVIPWTGASWGRQKAWDFESPHHWAPLLPPPPKVEPK